MAKAKQGDLFSCVECGLVVIVDEACGCAAAEIVCCDRPMAKGKFAADKARKKAAPPKSGCAKMGAGKAAKAKYAKPKATAKKTPAKKATVAKKK